VLFQQCLVDVFGFLKKLFFSNNRWSPPSPWSFAFRTPVLYPVDPPYMVLRISHFGSLPCRPPRPVLRISHFGSLTRRAPLPCLSHFPLRFFTLLIPPARSFAFPTPVLYPVDPPRPFLHISHSNSLTFWFVFLRTQHEQKNRRFLSFQQPCRADGFRGRTATSLAGSLTLTLF